MNESFNQQQESPSHIGVSQYPDQSQNPTVNQPNYGQRQQNPLANYHFSSDEMRILRECNSESFFQRCIPLSTVMGFSTHMAVKSGYLTANPKFGSIPKVVVSVVIGYFLGKISYQQKCAEKMMQLPNSKLGEILRQRKQRSFAGTFDPNQSLGTGFGLSPFSGSPSSDVYDDTNLRYSDAEKINSLDLDTERPSYNLDDNSSFDAGELPLEPPKKLVSYEELRKQNRDNYYKRMQSNVPGVLDSPPVVRVREQQPSSSNTKSDGDSQKNQYGDVWSQ